MYLWYRFKWMTGYRLSCRGVGWLLVMGVEVTPFDSQHIPANGFLILSTLVFLIICSKKNGQISSGTIRCPDKESECKS
jgi:hypothetical protein